MKRIAQVLLLASLVAGCDKAEVLPVVAAAPTTQTQEYYSRDGETHRHSQGRTGGPSGGEALGTPADGADAPAHGDVIPGEFIVR